MCTNILKGDFYMDIGVAFYNHRITKIKTWLVITSVVSYGMQWLIHKLTSTDVEAGAWMNNDKALIYADVVTYTCRNFETCWAYMLAKEFPFMLPALKVIINMSPKFIKNNYNLMS